MSAAKIDYDLRYNPRLTVPDWQQAFARWDRGSEEARARLETYLDVPYGPGDAEKLDVFRSQGESRALLVFIHGGYWRSLDKKNFSFLAPALTRAGVTLAVPNYSLCPAVRIRDIVMQMVQACSWLYRNGPNFGAPARRLYVCGHSAGGHLTAMMLATLWPAYAGDLPRRTVQAGFSISGLYDLEEIRKTPSINGDVRLDPESARAASPVLMPPATDAPLYTAVGEKESEGFHIQNRLIAERWKKVHKGDLLSPGDDHFTVLERLTDSSSALHRALLAMMGL
ncbi:MAG TPA: alpha/beta hydrolase [Burkholderiales bacterium]|nr:alpha/beta hydrolase [Burkholderiales bacterium]